MDINDNDKQSMLCDRKARSVSVAGTWWVASKKLVFIQQRDINNASYDCWKMITMQFNAKHS